MIEIDCVTKFYGSLRALHEVSLKPAPERTTVLIGPSGCGKSTMLRLIIGLIVPDAGTVRFEDRPIPAWNPYTLRHRMGYVIQDGGLFPHLTARDNVTLLARHLGWEAARIEERLTALGKLVHLPSDRLDDFPAQLSGGQQQRVGLMRALMLDPDVLLLDEPLGALDPMIRADLQADLRDIFRSLHKTVVMVTHDLGEAGFLGDEIILMRGGQIEQAGTLEDLVVRAASPFVEAFIHAQRSPLESIDTSVGE